MAAKYISVDIEADGSIPGPFSMVCFGAVVVEPGLTCTFYGKTRPISDMWVAKMLAISGYSREEHLTFPDPKETMTAFKYWLGEITNRPMFVADNPGFDWQFINWYFHSFCGENPFGYSQTHLGSLYKGMVKSVFKNFKHLRVTEHTHNPVDDARGNAEAFLAMKEMGLDVSF
jgi:hypothetical protein